MCICTLTHTQTYNAVRNDLCQVSELRTCLINNLSWRSGLKRMRFYNIYDLCDQRDESGQNKKRKLEFKLYNTTSASLNFDVLEVEKNV